MTSEYATGQIRATLGANSAERSSPPRPPFTGSCSAPGWWHSFSAFWVGQGHLASKGLEASLTDPGVLRAVFGGERYLTGVGSSA